MRSFVLLLGILALFASSASAATLVVHLREGGIAANLSSEEIESAKIDFALKVFIVLADAGIKSVKISPLPYLGSFIVETKEAFDEAKAKLTALREVQAVSRPMEAKVLSSD
jgi:hypothetical protein